MIEVIVNEKDIELESQPQAYFLVGRISCAWFRCEDRIVHLYPIKGMMLSKGVMN